MARNHPFDFSDDDDLAGAPGVTNIGDAELSESGSAELHGMGENLMDESGTGRQGGRQAGTASQRAAQTRTTTQARGSTGQPDNPTSMQRKRGNQPR